VRQSRRSAQYPYRFAPIQCIKNLEISEYSNVSFVNISVVLALVPYAAISTVVLPQTGVNQQTHNGSRQFPRRDFQ
jgi:hypothetical protein